MQGLLESIGITKDKARKVINDKSVLSDNDIRLDDKHTSPEMLNSNIQSIRKYLNGEAWAKFIRACMFSTCI